MECIQNGPVDEIGCMTKNTKKHQDVPTKHWEWLGLVGKSFPHLWGVFLSYLGPPRAHIKKEEKKINYVFNYCFCFPIFPIFLFSQLFNQAGCRAHGPLSPGPGPRGAPSPLPCTPQVPGPGAQGPRGPGAQGP